MKKITSLAISSFLLVTALAGCNNQATIDPALLAQTDVSAQASKKITLSMDKKNSTEIKNDSKAKIKEKNSLTKSDKKGDKLVVTFTAPSGKNDLDSQNIAMIARYSLNSMNQATTWMDGYNIGIQALSTMAGQGVYVARVSWSAANATKNWDNGYKMVAAALNHLANERPNTPAETCTLVLTMMGATTGVQGWMDGYKGGYAALQIMGQTDNPGVKSIIELALRQADSTREWRDGYNVLINALAALRSSF